MKRSYCRECDVGTYQPNSAQTSCIACGKGYTTSGLGRSSCDACVQGEYYRSSQGTCIYRGAPCTPGRQYELPESANGIRVCRDLNPCDTSFYGGLVFASDNARSSAIQIKPRKQYITLYASASSNWECWTWQPCFSYEYVLQLPMDDDNGYLMRKQVF